MLSLSPVCGSESHTRLPGRPQPPAPFLPPHSCLQLFSAAPGEKGRGCPRRIRPAFFGSEGSGLPKGPECGAAALPPPHPSLCLPRRTAGSAPPRGGQGPSEGGQRGEEARPRRGPAPGLQEAGRQS